MSNNKRKGDMFNERLRDEKIGHLRKSNVIDTLKPVEDYFIELAEKWNIKTSYDVVADEAMKFETLSYTEWGTNFVISPLQYEVRRDCITESLMSPEPVYDYVGYYKDLITKKQANKYVDRVEPKHDPRKLVVILVGTNKLKDSIDIEKLVWLAKRNDGDIWFKPHPLTTHEYIGWLQDRLGVNNVLERDEDMLHYILGAEKVYTTHYSESLLYSSILGKPTEPVDIYAKRERSGFFHLSHFLFKNQFNEDAEVQINRVLSCSRSGVINPVVQEDWKEKMEAYFEYIMNTREKYSFWYRPHKLAKKN